MAVIWVLESMGKNYTRFHSKIGGQWWLLLSSRRVVLEFCSDLEPARKPIESVISIKTNRPRRRQAAKGIIKGSTLLEESYSTQFIHGRNKLRNELLRLKIEN